ncbi:MAG TPA: hypothetical protein ENK43_06050 [Planctomycetes bacterium]|nr:hypothetical protein [Planctomycetota bacterium]
MNSTTLQALLAGVLLSVGSFGQSFTFMDFSASNGITLVGDAAFSPTSLFLTTGNSLETSAAWFTMPLGVVTGFDTQFDFQLFHDPAGLPAEGFAFVLQNAPEGASALGAGQSNLGYGGSANGIPNSLVIEVDTVMQPGLGDSSSNEISVHTAGPNPNLAAETVSVGRVTPSILMADGQPHTLRVVYVPGTLDIYLDALPQPVLSIPYDFGTGGTWSNSLPVPGLDLFEQTSLRVGFTGATSTIPNAVATEILQWSWTSTGGPAACFAGTVGASAGMPESVLTVNGDDGGFLRRVQVPTFQPLSLEIAQPSTMTAPSAFLVFGYAGEADGSHAISLPIGDFCFPAAVPFSPPGSYLIANSFGIPAPALVPSTLAPWNLLLTGGFPFETTATYQAVIQDFTAPFGLAISNAVIVDFVTAPPPVIQDVFPRSPAPGDLVTLIGEGFLTNYQITVDGIAVSPVLVSDGYVVFVYPPGVSCDAAVTVVRPDGQSASTTINPTPVITSVLSPSGSAQGGQTVILQGMDFVEGSTVTIGGVPAAVVSLTEFAVVVTTPPGTPGPAPIVLTTPYGCTVTETYTYL